MLSVDKRKRLLTTSVVKKFLSALTGIGLCLFLIGHLGGNLLIFLYDGSTFNAYAHHLETFPLLIPIELGLIALFLLHAVTGLYVYAQNKRARPQEYHVKKWTRDGKLEEGPHKSRKGVSSTTMAITGTLMLVFIIFHVWHFKFGPRYDIPVDAKKAAAINAISSGQSSGDVGVPLTGEAAKETKGQPLKAGALESGTAEGGEKMRDLSRLMFEQFKNPLVVLVYIAGLLLVGFHLNHGVSSAFQSMGVGGYGKTWLLVGRIYTIVIIGGFLSIPLWIFLFRPTQQKLSPDSTSRLDSSTRTMQSTRVSGAKASAKEAN